MRSCSIRPSPAGKTRGRKKPSITEYLVRWAGYGAEEDSWLQKSELGNAKQKLDEYWAQVHASST